MTVLPLPPIPTTDTTGKITTLLLVARLRCDPFDPAADSVEASEIELATRDPTGVPAIMSGNTKDLMLVKIESRTSNPPGRFGTSFGSRAIGRRPVGVKLTVIPAMVL